MINTKDAITKISNGEYDNVLKDVYVDENVLDYQKKRY